MSSSHLVLGTAQLGYSYGIANKTGQPNQDTAAAIIHEAWKNGIREFDTAQAYGDSELVLGAALTELGLSQKARIITKFDPNLDHLNEKNMARSLDQSLQRLGVSSLFGIMLHGEEMLSFWNHGLAEIMNKFVLSGKTKRVGVSVYSPDKAIEALNTKGIDMVQVPANILDRRFENAGVFKLADDKGKTVYVRSVFLQGLILMNFREIPEEMAFARSVIKKIESFSGDSGLSRQELALGYIKSEMPNAYVIFGVETLSQVRENMTAWQKEISGSLGSQVKSIFADVDEQILNPGLWSKVTC